MSQEAAVTYDLEACVKNLVIGILMLSIPGLVRAGGPSLKDCRPIGQSFRIGPYLTVAKELQQLGQEWA